MFLVHSISTWSPGWIAFRYQVVPCFPSHPRDTTGAGDAFNGALAARLACGEPLQAAARFAAAYAAVSVEKQGASSLPEYLEAQERLLRAAADYEMA
ncbi:putative ribokinase [Klebsiella pneumoniae]|nr:putative ribokinase [Klebsiella pneumoniae]SXB16337.1 putative ribokinase [Klebsiella pneumoniae]